MTLVKPYPHIARGEEYPSEYLTDTEFIRDVTASFQLLKRDLIRLFEYIEPQQANLSCFSRRTYEVLLRACTEVESLSKAVITVNQAHLEEGNIIRFSDLNPVMKLCNYEIKLFGYDLPVMKPFEEYSAGQRRDRKPGWYKAYNNVKHNRSTSFSETSLQNVLEASAAVYILISAQIGKDFDPTVFKHIIEGDYVRPLYSHDLFEIVTYPTWHTSEQYSFDWQLLRGTATPYEYHPLPKVIP